MWASCSDDRFHPICQDANKSFAFQIGPVIAALWILQFLFSMPIKSLVELRLRYEHQENLSLFLLVLLILLFLCVLLCKFAYH